MEEPVDIPAITKLSTQVVRVLGQNPGKFTLQGTNTYIIGSQNPYILVDTAEGRQEYIPVLDKALREAKPISNPSEPDVSDIIISHWHYDHVGGLPSVLTLLRKRWEERNPQLTYKPPRLHKYPIRHDILGHHSTDHNKLSQIIKSLPAGSYSPAEDGSTFHPLSDGQLFRTSPTIHILHTPGHTIDSIAFELVEDRALYTADTVLGQGTAVFEDLALYLQSLDKMLKHNPNSPDSYRILYPAHGPVVEHGRELIANYIKHRLEREQQILEVLRKPPVEGDNWTTWTIVKVLYAAYPENLWIAAAHGIELHLKKLEGEGIVRRLGGDGVDTAWKIVSRRGSPTL